MAFVPAFSTCASVVAAAFGRCAHARMIGWLAPVTVVLAAVARGSEGLAMASFIRLP
jgi:hypothetical protein